MRSRIAQQFRMHVAHICVELPVTSLASRRRQAEGEVYSAFRSRRTSALCGSLLAPLLTARERGESTAASIFPHAIDRQASVNVAPSRKFGLGNGACAAAQAAGTSASSSLKRSSLVTFFSVT